MSNIVGHLINGQMLTEGERTQPVYNPSTGEVSGQVSLASRSTVEEAIAAAQAAFPEWRATPPIKRRSRNGVPPHPSSALASCSDSKNCWRKMPTASVT